MLNVKFSAFQRVFWSMFIFTMIAGSAFGAISDSDFVELCMEGSLKQVVDAINGGANVNVKINGGFTPLLFAAAVNPDPEVVLALINAGADVKVSDDKGYTPLILAAGSGNADLKVISALIKAGADVNVQSGEGWTPEGGWTPLMAVSGQSLNLEIIKELINAGADVNIC